MVCPIQISAGLQNKIIEAMSLGIPVIATNQVALPITKDCSILPQANSVEDWCSMILTIINNSAMRQSISQKSRQFVMETFNWHTEVKKINWECKNVQ